MGIIFNFNREEETKEQKNLIKTNKKSFTKRTTSETKNKDKAILKITIQSLEAIKKATQ